MTRFIIGNLQTGRKLLELPVLSGSWDDALLTPENVKVQIDLRDPSVLELDLRNTTMPGVSFLAACDGDVVYAAGPIWTKTYDRDAATLDINAKGLMSYFDHRLVMQLVASTIPVEDWVIADPDDNTKTIVNPALTVKFEGLTLGAIQEAIVKLSMTWQGGNLPITFQPFPGESNGEGDSSMTYEGVDFKAVSEALMQIAQTDGGPEVNFLPRFQADHLGVQWEMQTGSPEQPLVTSNTVSIWDMTIPDTPATGLTINEDGTNLGSLAYVAGGRKADKVMVGRSFDKGLLRAGFPLLEMVDSSTTSVSDQNLLDARAIALTRGGRTPVETWSFDTLAYPFDEDGIAYGPLLSEYRVGDFIILKLAAYDPDNNVGDVYLPNGGSFPQRIMSISGDHVGEFVSIKCVPAVGS